jgi:hypothetical protein
MEPKELSDILKTWRVSPQVNPGFRASVWKRINRNRAPQAWVEFAYSRAAVLTAAAVVTIAVSGWTGRSMARMQTQSDRHTLAASYLASLDPRVKAGLQE